MEASGEWEETKQSLLQVSSNAMEKFSEHQDEQALQELKQVRRFLELHLGKELPEAERQDCGRLMAVVNNNLACIYRRKRLPFSAIKLLQRTLRIESENHSPQEVQAQTLLNLGVVYQELNRVDTAIAHF
jgi:tetratricopeptide (TPR) repeat protein